MAASNESISLTRPDVLLRLEALAALMVACIAYQYVYPGHWGMFALLFLVPDLSLLGYLRSAGANSAALYNLVHCDVLPLALGLIGWRRGLPFAGQVALIWLAHISFDRCLGYGLKFPGVFRYTHIQRSANLEQPSLLQ